MLLHFRSQNSFLFPILSPLSLTNQTKPKLSKTLTLILASSTMAAEPSSRRATCPSCSKPSRLCLCTRIKHPNLNNSIAITVLQHSLEQNHPLNSTRIAALGLRNLKIVPVFDVHLEAQFRIWPICSDHKMGLACFEEGRSNGFEKKSVLEKPTFGVKKVDFVDASVDIRSFRYDSEMGLHCVEKMYNGSREKSVFEKSASGVKNLNVVPDLVSKRSNGSISNMGFGCFDECSYGCDENLVFERPLISFVVSKKGVFGPNFDLLFCSPLVLDVFAKGFIVKKWQNKSVNGSITHEQFEEFEIVVPPGSALLFPSESSVGIEAIDFKVKNLIVLDGTWAKAKRIYSENPWLKALPHLRLDLDKLSLYSEVRRQPKASYLSSLESIVYAMKGLGEESDGFYQLLEVFESMVGDQRRCKDERLRSFSESGSIDAHSNKHIPAVDNF